MKKTTIFILLFLICSTAYGMSLFTPDSDLFINLPGGWYYRFTKPDTTLVSLWKVPIYEIHFINVTKEYDDVIILNEKKIKIKQNPVISLYVFKRFTSDEKSKYLDERDYYLGLPVTEGLMPKLFLETQEYTIMYQANDNIDEIKKIKKYLEEEINRLTTR